MRTAAFVCLYASLVGAIPAAFTRRDTPISVKLHMTGNTEIKAVIINNGPEDLKIFKTGTFLESSATEKVEVYQHGVLLLGQNLYHAC
jgi:deuterolysin